MAREGLPLSWSSAHLSPAGLCTTLSILGETHASLSSEATEDTENIPTLPVSGQPAFLGGDLQQGRPPWQREASALGSYKLLPG